MGEVIIALQGAFNVLRIASKKVETMVRSSCLQNQAFVKNIWSPVRGSLEAEFHATCVIFLSPSVLRSFECDGRVLALLKRKPPCRFTDLLLINYWIYLTD